MASGGQQSKFLNPSTCSMDDCEVTLLLDGQTRLYACKDDLMDKCGFFKGLFSADFKEKNSNEVEIKEVPHSDMLLFLECEFGHKSLPSDADSLCTLISLADQFMCTSLQERLIDHLDTESMFLNLSLDTKLALMRAADEHKGTCLPLLETSIRLCANLELTDVSVLSTQISSGAMVALSGVVAQAAEYIEDLTKVPIHPCGVVFGLRAYSKKVQAWHCVVCKEKIIKETFTYRKVKQFVDSVVSE